MFNKKNIKIPLDKFIDKALYHPKNGYYMRKVPFGQYGDFVTAPNISKIFSEMVFLWLISYWEKFYKGRKINIVELVTGAVSLQKMATPEVKFSFESYDETILTFCDQRQFTQAINNLLLNAIDAIEQKSSDSKERDRIEVFLHKISNEEIQLTVEDNGCGLPEDLLDRLAEPYITTRDKGTGLGLAIVKKIIEDHGGSLVLAHRKGGGAKISLIFPINNNPDGIEEPTQR